VTPGPESRRAAGRTRRWLAAATAVAVLPALAACTTGKSTVSASPSTAGGWHGVEPDPVPDRPDFVLRDTAGNRFDFRAETAGRPTLVYFGYTNCPDECITAMADIAAALRRVDPEVRERTKVVLVTTDPARDTPPVLRAWLDRFSTEFIGLVGTVEEVDAAQRAAGIQPALKEGPIPTLPGRPNEHAHKPGTPPHTHSGPLGYGVGHANVIFAYSSDDVLPVVYPGGSSPSDIAADLPRLAQ
jgi:protein SCO1